MQQKRFHRISAFLMVLLLTLSLCAQALAGYKTIAFGDRGDHVRTMQSALRKKGHYKGKVDGHFGPETRKGVIRYQNSLGIKADGKPGNKTLTALYDGGSKAINTVDPRKARNMQIKDPSSIYYGSSGKRVRYLQHALRAAGYFKGAVDGNFGELTELAVRKFQTAKGMHVDGIAGRKTIARLNNAQKKVKIGGSFILDSGSRGEIVSSLHRHLIRLGYSVNDPRGVYGSTTKDSVRDWQKDTNREQTGTMTESQYNSIMSQKTTP